MNDITKNFVGRNIRRWRKAHNITQEQLALRADLTQGYINQIESGKKWFSLESLQKIANALGIPIALVFEEEDSVISIDRRRDSADIVGEFNKKFLKQRKDALEAYIKANKKIDATYKMVASFSKKDQSNDKVTQYVFLKPDSSALGAGVSKIKLKKLADALSIPISDSFDWENDRNATTRIKNKNKGRISRSEMVKVLNELPEDVAEFYLNVLRIEASKKK